MYVNMYETMYMTLGILTKVDTQCGKIRSGTSYIESKLLSSKVITITKVDCSDRCFGGTVNYRSVVLIIYTPSDTCQLQVSFSLCICYSATSIDNCKLQVSDYNLNWSPVVHCSVVFPVLTKSILYL